MSQDPAEVVRGYCPKCGEGCKAFVRGKHTVNWSDDDSPASSSDTGMVLECCGCERIYFRRDFWFSEWESMGQNPYTGEPEIEGGTETTYWPAPTHRKPP